MQRNQDEMQVDHQWSAAPIHSNGGSASGLGQPGEGQPRAMVVGSTPSLGSDQVAQTDSGEQRGSSRVVMPVFGWESARNDSQDQAPAAAPKSTRRVPRAFDQNSQLAPQPVPSAPSSRAGAGEERPHRSCGQASVASVTTVTGGGSTTGTAKRPPNPTSVLTILSCALKPGRSAEGRESGVRAFTEMVTAGVASGGSWRGSGVAAAGGAGPELYPLTVPSTRDTSGLGSSALRGIAPRQLPSPRSYNAASCSSMMLAAYDESAPASPLKKVKSSHFPLGSPLSLAAAAAANSANDRNINGTGDGEGGAFFCGPANNGRDGARGTTNGGRGAAAARKRGARKSSPDVDLVAAAAIPVPLAMAHSSFADGTTAATTATKRVFGEEVLVQQQEPLSAGKLVYRRASSPILPSQQQQQQVTDTRLLSASSATLTTGFRRTSDDLRRNCDYCVKKKVKCSGTMPCTMCNRKGLQCEFSLKQKPGPKVRPMDGLCVDDQGLPLQPAPSSERQHCRQQSQSQPPVPPQQQQQQQQLQREREREREQLRRQALQRGLQQQFAPQPIQHNHHHHQQSQQQQRPAPIDDTKDKNLDSTAASRAQRPFTSYAAAVAAASSTTTAATTHTGQFQLHLPSPSKNETKGAGGADRYDRSFPPAPFSANDARRAPLPGLQNRQRILSDGAEVAGFTFLAPPSPAGGVGGGGGDHGRSCPGHRRFSSASSELNQPFAQMGLADSSGDPNEFGTFVEEGGMSSDSGSGHGGGPPAGEWGGSSGGGNASASFTGGFQNKLQMARWGHHQQQQEHQHQEEQQQAVQDRPQQPSTMTSLAHMPPEVDQSVQALLAMRRGFNSGDLESL